MSKCSHSFFVNYNINDVLSRQQNKPMNPTATVPKKEILLLLPYLGLQSKIITQQLLACINKFYECIDLRVIFQNTHRNKSLFPYKDRLNRSQMSKVVYKASCWDCQDLYIGKTKRRLHERKTDHFKAITGVTVNHQLLQNTSLQLVTIWNVTIWHLIKRKIRYPL